MRHRLSEAAQGREPPSVREDEGEEQDADQAEEELPEPEEEGEPGSDEGEQQRVGSGYPGGDDEWEEVLACPLSIRFTQDKIHPFFYRRGPIVNVVPKIRRVGRSCDDVLDLVPPFAPIHCLRKGDVLWSMDNRRLYALQLTAMDLWPRRCRVRCLSRERLPRHKFKTQYRKFNTTSEGRVIDVSTRYQQFDTWSWHERAIELEWYSLSKRLGTMLSIFEVAPVLGALLFRSGLTGFTSRVPLVVGFVLACAMDVIRQQVPLFERKLCETQVKAIMDGEVLQFSSWGAGKDDEDEPSASGISSAQLAATMAAALILLLPYILGVARDKVRSSLFSCWLGVAFMLAVQLATTSWSSWDSSGVGDGGSLKRLPRERRRSEETEGGEDQAVGSETLEADDDAAGVQARDNSDGQSEET
eukprot:TRINITY_DN78732_c0_g1_i1.p1 TRINITY_DN78732_c0_g1~~TRINITY_DN78732_c0_g1_i1.p1  ORF type:complete len:415 (-),score=80.79 TRINITY_DN78732_c0_g1_i1:58-1302(-)